MQITDHIFLWKRKWESGSWFVCAPFFPRRYEISWGGWDCVWIRQRDFTKRGLPTCNSFWRPWNCYCEKFSICSAHPSTPSPPHHYHHSHVCVKPSAWKPPLVPLVWGFVKFLPLLKKLKSLWECLTSQTVWCLPLWTADPLKVWVSIASQKCTLF